MRDYNELAGNRVEIRTNIKVVYSPRATDEEPSNWTEAESSMS